MQWHFNTPVFFLFFGMKFLIPRLFYINAIVFPQPRLFSFYTPAFPTPRSFMFYSFMFFYVYGEGGNPPSPSSFCLRNGIPLPPFFCLRNDIPPSSLYFCLRNGSPACRHRIQCSLNMSYAREASISSWAQMWTAKPHAKGRGFFRNSGNKYLLPSLMRLYGWIGRTGPVLPEWHECRPAYCIVSRILSLYGLYSLVMWILRMDYTMSQTIFVLTRYDLWKVSVRIILMRFGGFHRYFKVFHKILSHIDITHGNINNTLKLIWDKFI